jgi:hypothetical protein
MLIGYDEHCWSDDGVLNIEGGGYVKRNDVSDEKEPGSFNALVPLLKMLFNEETRASVRVGMLDTRPILARKYRAEFQTLHKSMSYPSMLQLYKMPAPQLWLPFN